MGFVVGRRILRHKRQYRPNWTPPYPCLDYTTEASRNSGRGRPFSASDPSFEFSQFQPVTTECGACVSKQHPQATFRHQVSLDSERQASDLGAIDTDHMGHTSTDTVAEMFGNGHPRIGYVIALDGCSGPEAPRQSAAPQASLCRMVAPQAGQVQGISYESAIVAGTIRRRGGLPTKE